LYDARNVIVNGPFPERALLMNWRIGLVFESWLDDERMPERLAAAVSYFMSCVNYFGGALDLQLGMMEKFPSYGCRYCGNMPCNCKPDRPDPTSYELDEAQCDWTFAQWQDHLKRVYGHYHLKEPTNFLNAFGRLKREFDEMSILTVGGPGTPNSPEDFIAECRREAADVLSWLMTLAYILGIDLEREILKSYTTCPGCERPSSCTCKLVYFSADGRFSKMRRRGYV